MRSDLKGATPPPPSGVAEQVPRDSGDGVRCAARGGDVGVGVQGAVLGVVADLATGRTQAGCEAGEGCRLAEQQAETWDRAPPHPVRLGYRLGEASGMAGNVWCRIPSKRSQHGTLRAYMRCLHDRSWTKGHNKEPCGGRSHLSWPLSCTLVTGSCIIDPTSLPRLLS